VFDPVHGVIHHFYQIHLATGSGHGPDYGHFVSRDFVNWAELPVAIWNGLDSSETPARVTPYDNEAIFTGSAIVMDGAGPNGTKGVVQIYPGLCNKNDWPSCETGTLLAQAVPADYEQDTLLVNWTKPSYNPIVENTQRDPSTPWLTPSGEYRLRTYDSKVYGAASASDMLSGKWYEIGVSSDFRTCECPSFYPLPKSTPGFEKAYEDAGSSLPTHVHKTSCGGDWWQLGTYIPGAPKELGHFQATEGWEDTFNQVRIDVGKFYASKDNVYPTIKQGETRRLNWGWAQVPPQSTQTLPREITFNAAARTLQQAPIEELKALRQDTVYETKDVTLNNSSNIQMNLKSGVAKQSEVIVTFELPKTESTFGVSFGHPGSDEPGTKVTTYMKKTDMPGSDYNVTHHPVNTSPSVCASACEADSKCKAWTYVVRGEPAGSGDCCLKSDIPCPVTSGGASQSCTSGSKTNTTLKNCGNTDTTSCEIHYVPPSTSSSSSSVNEYYNVSVSCGSFDDTLRLLPEETDLELRIYSDATFLEAYFQQGRIAITAVATMDSSSDVTMYADSDVSVSSATAYSLRSIWVSEDEVRNAARVYH
jgi:sucrose-6-phosphate hydrolase SacC (GH32 family)